MTGKLAGKVRFGKCPLDTCRRVTKHYRLASALVGKLFGKQSLIAAFPLRVGTRRLFSIC